MPRNTTEPPQGTTISEKTEVFHGSGNVFADLGLPDAEELLAKAELARQIMTIIDKRRLSQVQAAEILGIDQPKVSALVRGNLAGFSFERLIHFLNLLGRDVQIVVKAKPRTRRQAGLKVVCA